MTWIALKMLTGDQAKYLGSIAGVAFAALLMTQQMGIFCGLMVRTTSQLQDIADADIWAMDPSVQYVDELRPVKDDYLYQVQSVPGVSWAVRLYKGQARMKLLSGTYQQALVIGLDDATMVGAPRQIVLGSLADLRQPDAVIMDENGYKYLWPGQPFRLGRTFEMNDHRGKLVGICKASRTFQTFPVLYTRYSQALTFIPQERRSLPFILVKGSPGAPLGDLSERIQQQTGLRALTRHEFGWKTMQYYLARTSIPQNFGTTVLLGFIVGIAISGQTFYSFVLENLNQFGSLKAMGVKNGLIFYMVMVQAAVVGIMGYCIGVGMACAFGAATQNTEVAFFLPWQVPVITAVAVALIMLFASMVSVRRVITLEPAIVFKG